MNTPTALSGANLRERFGWRADRRPEPGFGHVLGAGAGAFFVFATMSLVAEITDDNATVPGILFSVALMVAAAVLGAHAVGPIRSACITVFVLTTPALWFFVFSGNNGEATRGDARAIYLLSIAVYAVLFILLWSRGRGVLLAVLLIAFTIWVLFEVGGDHGGSIPFSDQVSSSSSSSGSFSFDSGSSGSGEPVFVEKDQGNTNTATEAVALSLGLIYLLAAWRLDRQNLRGLATPFIAVGAIAGIAGAISLGAEDSVLAGGLSAAAIGAIVGVIGGLGFQRRGTTWIGVIFIVGGLIAIAADTSDDPLGLAGLFALFAIALGALAILASQHLREYPDGDEQASPLSPGSGPIATASAPAKTTAKKS